MSFCWDWEASQVSQWWVKNLPTNRRCGFEPWFRKIPCRRKWQPTPAFLPGKFHGKRSLAGYSPWDHRVRHDLAIKQQLRQSRTPNIWFDLLWASWPSLRPAESKRTSYGLCIHDWLEYSDGGREVFSDVLIIKISSNDKAMHSSVEHLPLLISLDCMWSTLHYKGEDKEMGKLREEKIQSVCAYVEGRGSKAG